MAKSIKVRIIKEVEISVEDLKTYCSNEKTLEKRVSAFQAVQQEEDLFFGEDMEELRLLLESIVELEKDNRNEDTDFVIR